MLMMTSRNADPVGELVCSRKGCSAEALYGMLWNNAKLHTPERRKVWLTCAEHQHFFRDYLASRGLLREQVPVEELPRRAES